MSRLRHLRRVRRVRLFVFGIPLVLGVAGLAYAYFTSQGGGAGAATTGSLTIPVMNTATPGAGTVTLAWGAVPPPAAGSVNYFVTANGGTPPGGTCGTSGSPISATTCTVTGLSAGSNSFTVTVIDVATMKARETFAVAVTGANRLKFSLDGRYVLVTGLGAFGPAPPPGGNNLVVLDAVSHRLIKAFQLGGGSAGILMEPSGARAFVAVNQGGKVAVIDLHTLQLTGEIPASQPDGMAWALH